MRDSIASFCSFTHASLVFADFASRASISVCSSFKKKSWSDGLLFWKWSSESKRSLFFKVSSSSHPSIALFRRVVFTFCLNSLILIKNLFLSSSNIPSSWWGAVIVEDGSTSSVFWAKVSVFSVSFSPVFLSLVFFTSAPNPIEVPLSLC